MGEMKRCYGGRKGQGLSGVVCAWEGEVGGRRGIISRRRQRREVGRIGRMTEECGIEQGKKRDFLTEERKVGKKG